MMLPEMKDKTAPFTCEGHVISEPVYGVPGAPALVMGDDGIYRQDVVSVWFLGSRRIIDKTLWDHVHEILSRPD